jgi:KUP system potassium uptake protein
MANGVCEDRFAVSTVMISTSTLVAVQMRYVKRLPILVAVSFFIFYGFIDGAHLIFIVLLGLCTDWMIEGLFWGASLRKVPTGAWVPLMLGLIM